MEYYRNSVQIAEDSLLIAAQQMYNVTREDAQRFQLERRELCKDLREQAEALIEVWEGTPEQCTLAQDISFAKYYLADELF